MTESQDVRLYSKAQVSLAAFLCLPIAGGILIGKNARAMGNPEAARQIVKKSAVWTVIALTAALFLPFAVPIANVFVVQHWYRQTQEAAFKDHIAQGGEKASWAAPIGFGLAGMVVLILVLAIISYCALMIVEFAWSTGDG